MFTGNIFFLNNEWRWHSIFVGMSLMKNDVLIIILIIYYISRNLEAGHRPCL